MMIWPRGPCRENRRGRWSTATDPDPCWLPTVRALVQQQSRARFARAAGYRSETGDLAGAVYGRLQLLDMSASCKGRWGWLMTRPHGTIFVVVAQVDQSVLTKRGSACWGMLIMEVMLEVVSQVFGLMPIVIGLLRGHASAPKGPAAGSEAGNRSARS